MKILVSACLLGENCKYSGGNNYTEAVAEFVKDKDVLQSRSPTCGVNQIYDGSFSGKLIPGSGVLAQALKDVGYQVMDAEDIKAGV